jgi:histidinol phosphatase-like PHP family hydrolase
MYFHEPTYDLDILAKQNLHIHTAFSNCAKVEMTLENIIETAEQAGLELIALADHFNTDNSNTQVIDHISALRRELQNHQTTVKVLFGAELSACGRGKCLDNEALRQVLDYKLYSCNHYHLDFWEQPEDKTPRGYVEHSIAVLSALIESGYADCIAHPMIGRFVRAFEDRTLITKAVTDNELGDLLELGKTQEVAWELNTGAVIGDPVFCKRLWNIGKEAGAVFNYGTDAHLLKNIDTATLLPEIKKILL